jgi:hypothetical protein
VNTCYCLPPPIPITLMFCRLNILSLSWMPACKVWFELKCICWIKIWNGHGFPGACLSFFSLAQT